MFGLFSGKKELNVTDCVWKNEAAKYKGILKNYNPNKKIIFLYYFHETKEQIKRLMDASQLPYLSDIYRNENITITNANNVLNTTTDLSDKLICFVEHHPSYHAEHTILQYLQNELNVKDAAFHISLDEPLFVYFGAEKIIDMLERLGMAEDECLQHKLITQSIVNAQKKIDEKTPNAVETASAKNWFEANLGTSK